MTCRHPAARRYAWFAYGDSGLLDTLCICCCDCGAVLQGAATRSDPSPANAPLLATPPQSFLFYDIAGRQRQLTPRKVAALVRKHRLPKRRIYGNMAVESAAWDGLMNDLGIPLAPGYKPAKEPIP